MSLFRRAGALISRYLFSAADPVAVAAEFKVYAKDGGGGISQLFGRSSDGTVYPLSPVGGVQTFTDLVVNASSVLNGMLFLRGEISPAAIAGTNNDYGPAGINTTASVIRQDLSAAAVLTGLFPSPRQVLIIHNLSAAFTLTLNHDDAASTANFRFFLPGNVPYAITPNGSATIRYDDTSLRWRLISL